jgi:hypothetical protein
MHLFCLLEIHTSPALESCPHIARGHGNCDPLRDLEREGLIVKEDRHWALQGDYKKHGWRLTERGAFYVESLQNLPLPEHRWEIPAPSKSASRKTLTRINTNHEND